MLFIHDELLCKPVVFGQEAEGLEIFSDRISCPEVRMTCCLSMINPCVKHLCLNRRQMAWRFSLTEFLVLKIE